jgi:hypothetical protein
MSVDFEKVITEKSQQTRNEFRALLDKTNKENSLHQPEAISSSFAAVSVEGKAKLLQKLIVVPQAHTGE